MQGKSGFIDQLAAPEAEEVQAEKQVHIPKEAKSALQELWDLEPDDVDNDFQEDIDNQSEDEFEDETEDVTNEQEGEDEDQEESDDEESEDDSEDTDNESDEEEDEAENPQWADMMLELFPEREFNTPQDYDNAVYDHIQNLQTQIQERDEASKDLVAIFKDYPQFAAMVKSLNEGDSDRVALIKAGYSPDDFVIEETDDDAEKLVEAKINLKKQREAEAKRKDEVQRNIQESQRHLESFKEKNGIPEKKWDDFLDRMKVAVSSFINGKITPDVIDHFWKGLIIEDETQKARTEGEIKGKNQKIVAEKKKRKGDGIPNLSRGSSAKQGKLKEPVDPFIENLERTLASKPKSFLEAIQNN